MALLPATRTGLTKYTAGTDPHPGRVKHNEQIDLLDSIVALGYQGTPAARPAAGKAARFFWDESAKRLAWDDGTAWQDLNPNGGGGAGAALAIGGAGAEGSSARSARADHTHPLPMASSTAPGAMSAADKALLNTATSAATGNALARRDADGRLSVANPVNSGHAAPKGYVDNLIDQAATYTVNVTEDISKVVTSTTRPTNPPLFQTIYEMDTKRTRRWNGDRWVCIAQPHTLFTPQWNGFMNLGGGYQVGGSYTVISERMVRCNMWLRGGSGASMGSGRLSVSLPFQVGGYPQQFGEGSLLNNGPSGVLRKIIGASGGGATAMEIWSQPDQTYSQAAMRTLGEAAYPFGQGSEIHMNFTYETGDI
jgi:hypothetical protein